MTKLRLTAVITNYNYGRYLRVAVEAMVRQSRSADELILIDDASTDGSQQVVDEIVQRHPFIKVVKHAQNRGVNESGQEGLDLASGDCFYWGSPDDMVLPGYFETAMALLEKFPQAPVCAGRPLYFREDLGEQFAACGQMPSEPGFLPPELLRTLVRRGTFTTSGAFAICRTASLRSLGGFRRELRWQSDWFLIYGLALGSGLCWTARPTAVMRLLAESYSNQRTTRRTENRQVLTELARLFALESAPQIRAGIRESGVMAQVPGPMLGVLLADRRYWRLISWEFLWVRFRRGVYYAMFFLARVAVPRKLRSGVKRLIGHRPPTQPARDLSVMKSPKANEG